MDMKCFSIFLLVVIIILTACGEIHIPPFRSEEIRTSTVIPVPSPTDTPLAPTLPAGPIVLFQSDRVIDLAVDPQAVYWLMRAGDNRSSDGVIMKLDRRDEKAQTLTDGLSQPNSLVSDIENLYWTETDPSDSQVTLMTAPKTGGTKYPLWEGPGYVASLALDEQFLYWSICTSKTSTLVKMPKRGGDIHPLVSGTGCPMSILLDGSRIY